MMKKMVFLFLVFFAQLFVLTGCRDKSSHDMNNMVQSEPVQKEDTYEAVTGVQSNDVTGGGVQNGNVTDGVNTEQNAEGYSGEAFYEKYANGNLTLKDLSEAVSRAIKEEYWPNEVMEEAEIQKKLGITRDQYDDCYFEYTHLKDNLDQLIIIEYEDDQLGNLEMALEKYRDNLIVEHQEQPINYAKANASRIEVIDDYICMVLLGGDLDHIDNDEERMLICQEQNEKAIDMLERILID